ncbi:MAG TPA: SIMPL domain-containing protein [Deltaproteobacteria bacterium]|nr:SIMPL domain-containing protein [Deltaproteobacteria bacterium]HQO60800.1 SIMPL domain-containing protein [Deltaproteobacteria bacterium]HUM20509.1 SIMPL domain-containing protein [Deltaproteobacteria bacterium]
MSDKRTKPALVLGAFLFLGLALCGYLVSTSILRIKALDRTITVKGLSEREVRANVAIWPIPFKEADNDLNTLSTRIQKKNAIVIDFLTKSGFSENEIFTSAPAVTDRLAQDYAGAEKALRYSGSSTISVYTDKVDLVRDSMKRLVDLGKQGVAISGQDYEYKTTFLFTGLNELKPAMVEEATRNAREVAIKFAQDSQSTLGKIRRASQGQFTIEDRDANTPYIKKVRVVSTVEYYLSD